MSEPIYEQTRQYLSREAAWERRIDAAMFTLWEARTQRKQPWTQEEWESVKRHPAHRASLSVLRKEAIQMLEDGEFDD